MIADALILLRHPSVAAPPGTCYGRTDPPLAASAAEEIAAALRALPPGRAVVASPAGRCRQLAEAIAASWDVPLQIDPRLRELDFGDWEGRPWAEIDRAESDPWAADPEHRAPPGGESFVRLRDRVEAALADLAPAAAVVTHAGPIRAAKMILTGASFADVFAEPVPHARPLLVEDRRLAWPMSP